MKRLLWIDISKGLAILFVAYFHFCSTYFQHGVLPPPDWSNLAASVLTILRLVWSKVSGLGFHAVGVFIIRRFPKGAEGDKAPTSDMMDAMRDLHARGQLSDDEYRSIKTKLATRLKEELADPDEEAGSEEQEHG